MPRPVTAVSKTSFREWRAWALFGFGATALAVMVFLATGLPAAVSCLLAVSAVSSFVLGTASTTHDTRWSGCADPELIGSREARASYRAIQQSLLEIEEAVAQTPRLGTSLASVLERCRATVALSGRLALLANPLQRYLDLHEAGVLRTALGRLHQRAEAASDRATTDAWQQAAAARARQLTTFEQIAAKRDQICARLELIHAALETFAAEIAKLQACDAAQIAVAGESITDQLDDISIDLEVLEEAVAPEADGQAAPAFSSSAAPAGIE
ncbi:MAG TPA: hypothetical protein VFT22_19790 [Kofleriaceae bacterium]|nr:hypothetical protein [Kofleriaceae bacterium]